MARSGTGTPGTGARRFSLATAIVAALALAGASSAFAQQSETRGEAKPDISAATAVFPVLPVPPDTSGATERDLAQTAVGGVARSVAARIEAPVVNPESLDLPEPPAVVAGFDDIEKVVAEKPVEIALPDLPEVTLSADVKVSENGAKSEIKPEMQTGSVARGVTSIDLPEPPAVIVSLEPPAPASAPKSADAGLKLDLDDVKLRALLEPARAKFRFKPAEIDAFVAAYSEREFRPYWLTGTETDAAVSSKAEALAAVLATADRDGLDPVRLVSALPSVRKGAIEAGKRAEVDIQFSVAAFLYARDARGGRLEPSRISALMTPQLDLPSAKDLLDRLAAASPRGVEAALEHYQPQHAGYRGLRKALAKLREELATPVLTGSIAGVEGAPMPTGILPANWLEGAPLAFDKADPRVPMLRQRLGMEASGSNLYDEDLRKAVIAFQRANELTPNARITPKTRAALENPQSPLTLADRKPDRYALLNALLTNMERWRWLPSDLGKLHVFVNVADFNLKVFADNAVVHQTRVIVGKPQTQTPIFSDRMEHLIVNPSWGVPASILKKEFLPKMAADPDYAAKRGFQVTRRGNSISIRQPPGERNALGFIKFIFPNEHSVYLHDTPNRNLFSADVRAFSHGCVRVDKPFVLAEKLLAASLGYSEQHLRSLIGRGERMIKLTDHIPVHLTYFTVFVDETGTVQQRRDLYGHDGRIKTALQL